MSYKPNDFFVKIIDIFDIFLPGALLAFLLLDYARSNIFGRLLPTIQGEAQGWITFIFASYLLGNFIYLFGRALNYPYNQTYRKYQRKKGSKLKSYAEAIKREQLAEGNNDIDVFRWATAVLRLQGSAAIAEIDRIEAVSKFFRSITVVFLVLCIVIVIKSTWITLLPVTGLLLLSMWRFMEQRWKRSVATYEHYIALMKLSKIELDKSKAPSQG
jgi:hypothetical protein